MSTTALFDDRRLITFDADHRLIVSPALAESGEPHDLTHLLTGYAGRLLAVPARSAPTTMVFRDL